MVKAMADRCLAGEFNGNYHRAAKEPECVALGISHQHIQYHMDHKCPLVAADRAADRARVAAEATAASSALRTNPVFVFVERGGSASAATAVSAIVGKLESASAELEAAEEKTAEMKKRLQELKAGQSDREAEVRRFAKESAREIAHLQVLLAGEQKRADAAVAKKSVMSEAKDEALHKARIFQQSLTRLQEKLAVIEAKPSSSDPGMTWDEEDVLDMESAIAQLTTELRDLKGVAKANQREFERNRGAVANMGGKYIELAELRETVKVLTAKITSLEAELVVARSYRPPQRERPRRDSVREGSPVMHFLD
jgi:chromosome segregation ATPase